MASIPKGTAPHYKLSVLHKGTDQRGDIGVAWRHTDGRISIKLSPCVTLPSDPDLVINLFPITKGKNPEPPVGEWYEKDEDEPIPY